MRKGAGAVSAGPFLKKERARKSLDIFFDPLRQQHRQSQLQ